VAYPELSRCRLAFGFYLTPSPPRVSTSLSPRTSATASSESDVMPLSRATNRDTPEGLMLAASTAVKVQLDPSDDLSNAGD
jgi:hypothetical protein